MNKRRRFKQKARAAERKAQLRFPRTLFGVIAPPGELFITSDGRGYVFTGHGWGK